MPIMYAVVGTKQEPKLGEALSADAASFGTFYSMEEAVQAVNKGLVPAEYRYVALLEKECHTYILASPEHSTEDLLSRGRYTAQLTAICGPFEKAETAFKFLEPSLKTTYDENEPWKGVIIAAVPDEESDKLIWHPAAIRMTN